MPKWCSAIRLIPAGLMLIAVKVTKAAAQGMQTSCTTGYRLQHPRPNVSTYIEHIIHHRDVDYIINQETYGSKRSESS